jgi:hypothetical protein
VEEEVRDHQHEDGDAEKPADEVLAHVDLLRGCVRANDRDRMGAWRAVWALLVRRKKDAVHAGDEAGSALQSAAQLPI